MLIVCIATILAASSGHSNGLEWDSLVVHYNKFTPFPVTVREATAQHWSLAVTDSKHNVDVYWRESDHTSMILYDKRGNLAGLRWGVPVVGVDAQAKKNNVTLPYDYDTSPMFSRQSKGDVFLEEFWFTEILFQPIDMLLCGGRPRLVRGEDEVALGVFINRRGQWIEVSRAESDIEAQKFYKQKCLKGMGQHYFYEINSSMECERMQGTLVGYEGGRLVMVGLFGFGNAVSRTGMWESYPEAAVLSMFNPGHPKCMDRNLHNVGIFSIHIYLVSHASQIACPK